MGPTTTGVPGVGDGGPALPPQMVMPTMPPAPAANPQRNALAMLFNSPIRGRIGGPGLPQRGGGGMGSRR